VLTTNEPEYTYIKEAVLLMKRASDAVQGCSYFLTGGNSIAMVRFGATTIKYQRGEDSSDHFFSNDDDLDWFLFCESKRLARSFCREVMTQCQASGIFEYCGPCMAKWPSLAHMYRDMAVWQRYKQLPHMDAHTLSRKNATHLQVDSWPYPYVIKEASVLPSSAAKYHEVDVPVARDPLSFLSQAVNYGTSYQGERPERLEYGADCKSIAAPSWLVGVELYPSQTGSHVPGLNLTLGVVKSCAVALRDSGYASFADCL